MQPRIALLQRHSCYDIETDGNQLDIVSVQKSHLEAGILRQTEYRGAGNSMSHPLETTVRDTHYLTYTV